MTSLPDPSHQLAEVRRRRAALRQNPPPPGAYELLAHSFEELTASLEELRVAEEELRQQNEALSITRAELEAERLRYEDLFQSAPEPYLVTDARGIIREANRRAYAFLKAGPRSLVGKPLAHFVPLEDRPAFRAFLRDAVGQGGTLEMRLMPTGAQGVPVAVAASVSAVPRPGGHGPSPLRWLIHPLDTEQEMERYRLLVAEVQDHAVILMDPRGTILDWNGGAEQIFGYRAAEMRGQPLASIFTPEGRAAGVPDRERELAVQSGRAVDECWLIRKDGSRFWASGSLTPLRGEGHDVRWFAKVLRDRTEQRLTEEETAHDLDRASRIAQTFQRALLPELPEDRFPGLRVATLYEAAWDEAQVGGDFYDAFALPGDRVALAVGDISGKGLGAAMCAGELRAALRTVLREGPDPAAALTRLNGFVCDRERLDGAREHLYATLALIVLRPETGEMRCALAGADPALILRAGVGPAFRLETTGARGLMLGVTPEWTYLAEAGRLGPGDRVLLMTDGLTEARPGQTARRDAAAFLGYEGVAALAAQATDAATVAGLCRAVLDGTHAHAAGPLADDACLLVAERL